MRNLEKQHSLVLSKILRFYCFDSKLTENIICERFFGKSKVPFTPRTRASLGFTQIWKDLLNSESSTQSSMTACFTPTTVVVWPQFNTASLKSEMCFCLSAVQWDSTHVLQFKHRCKHWAWELSENP